MFKFAKMSHIFLSYSHKDCKVAENLCSFLEERGLRCWIAPRDISSGNFAGEITRSLKSADVVLVLCSRQSASSEHVKNEVSLAFSQGITIIPYCLDEDPFDDDLQYYLATKQRVQASGNTQKDFETILRMLGAQSQAPLQAPQKPIPARKRKGWVALLAAAAGLMLAGGVFLLLQQSQKQEGEIPQETIPAEEHITPGFTGALKNGYPDGYGSYTFATRRRIDMHDPAERYAEPGDVIEGDWKDGHLNYGKWRDSHGTEKDFIVLGDHPDTDSDKLLWEE